MLILILFSCAKTFLKTLHKEKWHELKTFNLIREKTYVFQKYKNSKDKESEK